MTHPGYIVAIVIWIGGILLLAAGGLSMAKKKTPASEATVPPEQPKPTDATPISVSVTTHEFRPVRMELGGNWPVQVDMNVQAAIKLGRLLTAMAEIAKGRNQK